MRTSENSRYSASRLCCPKRFALSVECGREGYVFRFRQCHIPKPARPEPSSKSEGSGHRRSGFYEWWRHPLSDRALEDQRLLNLIRAAYTASYGVYGAPRIFLDFGEVTETWSRYRVARIMRADNMNALHGYRAP